MCEHVSAQVAGVVEAGRAVVAPVRLLSRVCPQVDLQAAVLREAFAALGAGVRLLPGVDAHVDVQRGLVDERLAATGARDRRLPGVSGPMHNEVFAAVEALPAEAAVQRFVRRVQEKGLLLGELADETGEPPVAVRSS